MHKWKDKGFSPAMTFKDSIGDVLYASVHMRRVWLWRVSNEFNVVLLAEVNI